MYTVNFEKHELESLLFVLEDKIEKLQWEHTSTKIEQFKQDLTSCVAVQGKLIRCLNNR